MNPACMLSFSASEWTCSILCEGRVVYEDCTTMKPIESFSTHSQRYLTTGEINEHVHHLLFDLNRCRCLSRWSYLRDLSSLGGLRRDLDSLGSSFTCSSSDSL